MKLTTRSFGGLVLATSLLTHAPSCSPRDDDNGSEPDRASAGASSDGDDDGPLQVICGNDVVELGEVCEPGLFPEGTPCEAADPRFTKGKLACKSDCQLSFDACESIGTCGNGALEKGEGCDDGNEEDGDGCSANCFPENSTEDFCGTTEDLHFGPLGQPHAFCDNAMNRDTYSPNPSNPLLVRVRVHSVRSSAGVAVATQAQVDALLANSNTIFGRAGVTLVQEGGLDIVEDPSDRYFNLTRGTFSELVEIDNSSTAVDLYLVSTFANLCGRAADIGLPSGADGVAVKFRCGAGTVVHELGHLFGLWHPHQPEGGACASSGDFVCDTPRDPGPDWFSEEGCVDNSFAASCSCTPTGNPACAPSCPDGSMPNPFLVMSYYGCGTALGSGQFSANQVSRLLCYVDSQYGYAVDAPCVDTDEDGYGFVASAGCRFQEQDCDDSDAAMSPGATETCDGRDEDCDGEIDEDLRRPCGESEGECDQGVQTCQLGNWGPCEGEVPAGHEVCDGLDNDCNGEIDDIDDTLQAPADLRCPTHGICADGEAETVCEAGSFRCDFPEGYTETECPVANESCGSGSLRDSSCNDGVDNDCDGVVDENSVYQLCVEHPDFSLVSSGQQCYSSAYGRCRENGGTYECVQQPGSCGVSIDCQNATFPEEERCDFLDWDCDGHVQDKDDIDKDGFGTCAGFVDCDETDATINPNGTEICDGKDNDCDGSIDEGVKNACGSCGAPPPEECNGIDDDCDGLVDEGVRNLCGGCGVEPVEVCNGIDDDCDGSVDETAPADEGSIIAHTMSTIERDVIRAYIGSIRDSDVYAVTADESLRGTFGCEGGCGFANERVVFTATLATPSNASGPYELCLGGDCTTVNPGRQKTLQLGASNKACCNGILCGQDNSATTTVEVRGVDACSNSPYDLTIETTEECVP